MMHLYFTFAVVCRLVASGTFPIVLSFCFCMKQQTWRNLPLARWNLAKATKLQVLDILLPTCGTLVKRGTAFSMLALGSPAPSQRDCLDRPHSSTDRAMMGVRESSQSHRDNHCLRSLLVSIINPLFFYF